MDAYIIAALICKITFVGLVLCLVVSGIVWSCCALASRREPPKL